MTFARSLRRLRANANFTQEGLALACGWPGQSRVANYESLKENAREPSLDDLRILARVLNTTYADLIDGVEKLEKTTPDEVETLEYVIKSLVSTMASYRPHEAAAMASAMRDHSGAQGLDQNLLNRLTAVLDSGVAEAARKPRGHLGRPTPTTPKKR